MLVAVHGCLSILYLQALPLFNWPDEPAHFNYVRSLSEGRGLGVMGPSVWQPGQLERLKRDHFEAVDPLGAEIAAIRYESHQPPLYYAASALVYASIPRIGAVKLVNLLLSSAVIVLIWAVGRRFFPTNPFITWAAALLVAVLPMRCFMALSIGNAVAAELFFVLFALALAKEASPVRVGLVIGCGLWAHTALLLSLPLYAAWLVLGPKGSRNGNTQTAPPLIRTLAATTMIAVAVWSPWLIHNLSLYGWSDPLALVNGALGSGKAVVAALGEARPRLDLTGPSGIASFTYLLFNSFWGVFGWMEMFFGLRIQGLFLLLSLPPAAGLVAVVVDHFRQSPNPSTRQLLWLGLTGATFIGAVTAYSLFDFQPQGRYLLTASVAFALLYGAGLERALGRWAAAGLVADVPGPRLVNIYGAHWVVPWYLAR